MVSKMVDLLNMHVVPVNSFDAFDIKELGDWINDLKFN